MQPWKISVGLTAILCAGAGQTDLVEKLEQEERGEYPGA